MSDPYLPLIEQVADVMRRCDPDYCLSHSSPATTDEEWDELLGIVEDACEFARAKVPNHG